MEKRQIGPFILEEQIGVGGMGVVYRAIYPKNNKEVAVKILSPGLNEDAKLVSRFDREMKILKRLKHPNIVKYYGGGSENNQRYYAMQFINGGSLQDMISQRGRLTWEQAIHVGRQVCSALEHAHNAGIIHRDLKPANLFLSRKGRLMLGDFGIARDTEATALTAAGKTVGTYAYMAPEQINGAHPICGKTDLYALGCLLYETMVGETPFVSDNPAEMLMQHLNDDPHNVAEFAPDCPIWLDKLVDRMLSKNPDDRPFDALAVHTELGEIRDKLADGNSVATTATSPAGQVATQADRDQLRKSLRKKKKKKKREDVPLHERSWFLATCLVALISLTAYLMWPKSIETLHQDARAAMAIGSYTDKQNVLEWSSTGLKRDPDGPYAADFQDWVDEINADKLDTQLAKKADKTEKGKNEFESECIAVLRLEKAPDTNPLAAIEKFYELLQKYSIETDKKEEEDVRRVRVLVLNCRVAATINELVQDTRLREHFFTRMKEAEELAAQGKDSQAREIWDSAARHFQDVSSVADYQYYALQQSQGERAELPPIETVIEDQKPMEESGAENTSSADESVADEDR